MAKAIFGKYTAREGEVYRNGIWLPMHVAEYLHKAFATDPDDDLRELGQEIGAAIRAAWAFNEEHAA